jgi:hypothetical protein
MPKISELPSVLTLDINDVAAFVSKDNQNVDQTMKVKVSEVATKVVNNIEYGSLNTSDKKVLGAINEVNGKAKENLSDLTDTTITTPSNADLLAYDSSTSKWVNTDLKGQASGSIATFSNGGNGIPVSEFECEIVAQQASGTPSPSSPLPITGFSQADITVTDNDQISNLYIVAFGQTVYGGRLIYANGQWSIEATFDVLDLGTLDWISETGYVTGLFRAGLTGVSPIVPWSETFICSCFTYSSTHAYASIANGEVANTNTESVPILRARWEAYQNYTNEQFKSAMGGQYILCPITPTIIPITSSTRVKTISGDNNIYSNTGDCELKYFTNKADSIAELIKAFML